MWFPSSPEIAIHHGAKKHHAEEREGVRFPLLKQRDFTGGTEVSSAWPPYLTGSTIQTVVFFFVQELLSLKGSYRGP